MCLINFQIYKGSSTSGIDLKKACGKEEITILVRSHQTYVEFVSDGSIQGTGFEARWEETAIPGIFGHF